MDKTLSHLNQKGEANMVDVSMKTDSYREASAQALVSMSPACFEALQQGNHKKGDVLATARIAGIQAAKQTALLIPLCHPLQLTKISLDFELNEEASTVRVVSCCALAGKTGVEMEALTAVSVAALTIYDMCKSLDKNMVINNIHLLSKTGGKSGDYRRHE